MRFLPRITTIITSVIMLLTLMIGLFASYLSISHHRTMADGLDDLGSLHITISGISPVATGVILKAKEYPSAFFGVTFRTGDQGIVKPDREALLNALPVNTEIDLSVKKEAASDMGSVSNLPAYKITLRDGRVVYDASHQALEYHNQVFEKYENAFFLMVTIPVLYFVVLIARSIRRRIKR